MCYPNLSGPLNIWEVSFFYLFSLTETERKKNDFVDYIGNWIFKNKFSKDFIQTEWIFAFLLLPIFLSQAHYPKSKDLI